jgi:hypothetical protein
MVHKLSREKKQLRRIKFRILQYKNHKCSEYEMLPISNFSEACSDAPGAFDLTQCFLVQFCQKFCKPTIPNPEPQQKVILKSKEKQFSSPAANNSQISPKFSTKAASNIKLASWRDQALVTSTILSSQQTNYWDCLFSGHTQRQLYTPDANSTIAAGGQEEYGLQLGEKD